MGHLINIKILIAAGILFTTANAISQPVTDGLVGYWPFNGNIMDFDYLVVRSLNLNLLK